MVSMRNLFLYALCTILIHGIFSCGSKRPPSNSIWIERVRQSTVQNLGAMVNSAAEDYAPTISADGQRIYFCSDRSGSMLNKKGKQSVDFWYADALNSATGSFKTPVNADTL